MLRNLLRSPRLGAGDVLLGRPLVGTQLSRRLRPLQDSLPRDGPLAIAPPGCWVRGGCLAGPQAPGQVAPGRSPHAPLRPWRAEAPAWLGAARVALGPTDGPEAAQRASALSAGTRRGPSSASSTLASSPRQLPSPAILLAGAVVGGALCTSLSLFTARSVAVSLATGLAASSIGILHGLGSAPPPPLGATASYWGALRGLGPAVLWGSLDQASRGQPLVQLMVYGLALPHVMAVAGMVGSLVGSVVGSVASPGSSEHGYGRCLVCLTGTVSAGLAGWHWWHLLL